MPFTHEQFLDVFGRYNQALWPAALAFWLVSAATVLWLIRSGRGASRGIAALLAVHWAWSGIAYHLAFFAAINPVARLFGALFVVEAACLAWLGVFRSRLQFSLGTTPRHVVASAFVVYSFLYPALSLLGGGVWPRLPLFAVPCPTTLFTAGLLLAADPPLPWLATVVPILWALVGGSAAFLLNVPADFALLLGALVLAVYVGSPFVTRRKQPVQDRV